MAGSRVGTTMLNWSSFTVDLASGTASSTVLLLSLGRNETCIAIMGSDLWDDIIYG